MPNLIYLAHFFLSGLSPFDFFLLQRLKVADRTQGTGQHFLTVVRDQELSPVLVFALGKQWRKASRKCCFPKSEHLLSNLLSRVHRLAPSVVSRQVQQGALSRCFLHRGFGDLPEAKLWEIAFSTGIMGALDCGVAYQV